MKTILLAASLMLGAPMLAQQPAPSPASVDYADPASWLCLPGRQDACARPLPTADLNPPGYGPVTRHSAAANPAIDCFYLYPTVSRDTGLNSDMDAGLEEQTTAAVQFARFTGVCRPFAPIYRQGTLNSIAAVAGGGNPLPILNLAYGDVVAAWSQYLRQHNQGRPFVLIGHSQGTIHLIRLIQTEIEGRPEAARMASAILLGFNVEVPEGEAVGGTFRATPLCTRASQTGCVVTYVSFRAEAPPPQGALFGRSTTPGRTVACTNPATLGSSDATPLESYWFTASPTSAQGVTWSTAGAPPAPFLHTRGLASGACVNHGPLGYLALSVNADPADARTDRIPGDVQIAGRPMPGWGTHLIDMSVAQGDLIRLVRAQAAAMTGPRR